MSTLFGREREVATLEGLVDGVHERGAALVVRGAAGIGKSALLAAVTERAEAGNLLVSTASGVQSETHLPFAGLHQLLRPMLGAAGQLPARQREALLGAFGMSEAGDPEPFLVALAVLNLLGDTATDRPLLIVVDDVQWLDGPTTEVLGFVARRVRSDPIVLLMALRDGHPTSLDASDLPELRLTGLESAAAEALLDAQAAGLSVGMRWRVLSEAAGNPLALVELPLALGAGAVTAEAAWLPLTARLERAFAVRLAELPPHTRALLLVAAANDGHDVADALAGGGIVAGAVLTAEALAPAVDAGLVELREQALRFRHPLVRSAIYQKAGRTDRLAAHAALALVHERDPDRRAWHRAAAIAQRDESVATELEGVAARARQRGAIPVAVTALRRAAEVSEEPAAGAHRLLTAAELAFELGRGDQAAELLALARPSVLGELPHARGLWLSEMLGEGRNDGPARIHRLVTTAEAAHAAGDRELALGFVRAAAIRCWWSDPGWEQRGSVIALAERLAAGDDDPELLVTLATAGAVERCADVIERLAKIRHTRLDADVTRLLGVAASSVGAFDLVGDFMESSIADLRIQGRLGLLTRALSTQVWRQIFCGDWAGAVLVAEEAERLARETGQPRRQASALGMLALLAGLRGEEERGLALAAEGERVLGTVAISAVAALIEHARGVIALCAGRHDDAFGHLWRLFEPGDAAHHMIWRLWVISELAEAAVGAGRTEPARRAVAELEQVAARTPSPLLHVGLRHARALLAGDAEAEALYQDALGADLSRWPTARARLLLTHGMWLRRRRRIQEARVPLRAARDAFDVLGLLAWGEKARQELRAAGETSDLRVAPAAELLTSQELHIARLAASGLSNREIGQQLYLSHRTVSTHLYRAFPKLGITSRGQLRDALEQAAPGYTSRD
ncbi:DNA-binding CsgD family transcriptional regulator [Nonomuraea thailandensis]|uniref:DNA-binding CsgD family transcriptional regulator n=1 Tax=Nonomuraea thailandensis TaxID=1188745 RepID=A0A9X2GEH2_9ACTN|nr:LuxR family transcriptional regulator [Nonomuraea thailandensis]MCP2356135.1 DNA-binding CsgD family transcriptional regulator [Nonomuraea thailandensis]